MNMYMCARGGSSCAHEARALRKWSRRRRDNTGEREGEGEGEGEEGRDTRKDCSGVKRKK